MVVMVGVFLVIVMIGCYDLIVKFATFDMLLLLLVKFVFAMIVKLCRSLLRLLLLLPLVL